MDYTEYLNKLADGVETGRIVAYTDDDGEIRLVVKKHATGYHYDNAILASEIRTEAEREESSIWN